MEIDYMTESEGVVTAKLDAPGNNTSKANNLVQTSETSELIEDMICDDTSVLSDLGNEKQYNVTSGTEGKVLHVCLRAMLTS